jgi:hypothetical protein
MLKEQLAPLVKLDNRRNYRLKELQALASENNIDKHWNAPVIEKGWEGKPKGLKQVLWERGFIDESIPLDEYMIMPLTNNDDDENAEDYSLLCMMSSCLDFAKEETALQYIGRRRNFLVHITPKFHTEIAGEGIEYSWGIAKGKYRREPLESKKQGKAKFHELVKKCVCNKNVLMVASVRKLSRRARAYICAYYYVENKMSGQVDAENSLLSLPCIEALMKEFKTHRSAIDFDSIFIKVHLRHIVE